MSGPSDGSLNACRVNSWRAGESLYHCGSLRHLTHCLALFNQSSWVGTPLSLVCEASQPGLHLHGHPPCRTWDRPTALWLLPPLPHCSDITLRPFVKSFFHLSSKAKSNPSSSMTPSLEIQAHHQLYCSLGILVIPASTPGNPSWTVSSFSAGALADTGQCLL